VSSHYISEDVISSWKAELNLARNCARIHGREVGARQSTSVCGLHLNLASKQAKQARWKYGLS